ncbi:MAG: O-antigen ligase family protein [Acidobacteriia bacterium]|nr:O-antigen ligase family protein [Terriglobia bacterium]
MATAPSIDISAVRKTSTSALDSIVFYGSFGLLSFAPLAFGAVEPWAIFVMEATAALLFTLWAVRQFQTGELRISDNPLFRPMLAFGVLVALQLATGSTAYRWATSSNALLYGAYGMLCFLVVQSLRRTRQVRTLAWAFSIYGFAVATFALMQSMSANGKLYWLRTPRSGGWIYGPYVNHNHYAGLMEMLVPVPLVVALSRQVHGPRKRLAIVAASVMASSIFLSGSRGGMTALAVQLSLLAAFTIRKDKEKEESRKPVLAIAVFLVILVGLLAWLGGGELTQRLASIHTEAQQELSEGTRLAMDRDGLKMFARKPVLGWGLGVFPEVYPQFRSFYTNFFVNAAHNDYVQLLVETGLLGFAVLLWYVVVLYRSALKKTRNWTTDTSGAVALAALLGCTGILVHSFLDFNLQIPANAALFYVLSVIAAMEPRFGLTRHRSLSRSRELISQLSA